MEHRNPHIPIHVYNTLSRKREILMPMDGKMLRMYTCGPTVYNYAHIGNLRTYIFEDLLKRTILYNKIPVLHVMNITDVGHLTSDADTGEDKMEKGAKREGRTVWDIAEFYTKAFKEDIAKLNILEPDIWCKATDHIPEQQSQVRQLIANGYAYLIGDGIYFDTAKLQDYGKLAQLDIEALKAGARVEVVEGKRSPTDFALWKISPQTRQMEWDFNIEMILDDKTRSHLHTWVKANHNLKILGEEGQLVRLNLRGFPGWHIECSAMSMKYLGDQFDLHCGGIDHIPVHHTNEIAQAEAATGKPWVQTWIHGEFLVIDKGKMAKSGENFLTLQTLIDKGYDPLVYRYFCLTATYDQQLSFSWEAMESARSSYTSLRTKIIDLHEHKAQGISKPGLEHEYRLAFMDAINDNLNMPKASAVLWQVLREDNLSNERKVELAEEFDAVLGLSIQRMASVEIPAEVLALARERDAVRQIKDFKKSDELRDEISRLGYVVDDKKDGSYSLRKR
jgi:cysteinyl-tRNA synthetase